MEKFGDLYERAEKLDIGGYMLCIPYCILMRIDLKTNTEEFEKLCDYVCLSDVDESVAIVEQIVERVEKALNRGVPLETILETRWRHLDYLEGVERCVDCGSEDVYADDRCNSCFVDYCAEEEEEE